MSEIDLWPTCGECTLRQGGRWVPVESYERLPDGPPRRLTCRSTMTIRASCSHGNDGVRPLVQSVTFDIPHWWGTAHELDAIKALRFFVPGHGAPEHGMVTDLG